MIENNESRPWLNHLLAQASFELKGANKDWIKSSRCDAKSLLDTMTLPIRKKERWRYSNVDKLFSQRFKIKNKNVSLSEKLTINDSIPDELDSYKIVVASGCWIPENQAISHIQDNATISSLQAISNHDINGWTTQGDASNKTEPQFFSTLNAALTKDGVFIHIGADVKLQKPIEIIYTNLEMVEPEIFHPRNLIVIEKGASMTLIERFLSSDQSLYFNNNLSEIVMNEQSELNHYRIQNENKQAYHMGSISVTQMAESTYNNTTLAIGSNWARTDFNVAFKGQKARCFLNGLYTIGDHQLIDFHSKIHHSVANCCSQENFKGILYGKGRAVFDGHIVVDKKATGTDALMSNENLLLTRNAEIDTKPQLEIYADDVKCSHGTTVGQLDPEQIFYLCSRGIKASTAKRMLCLGFADEIINTIKISALTNKVKTYLQNKIELASL